jgi:hypothetical protein
VASAGEQQSAQKMGLPGLASLLQQDYVPPPKQIICSHRLPKVQPENCFRRLSGLRHNGSARSSGA